MPRFLRVSGLGFVNSYRVKVGGGRFLRTLLATTALVGSALTLPLRAVPAANAQTVWTGNTNNDWNNSGNWTLGAIPDGNSITVLDGVTGNSGSVTALTTSNVIAVSQIQLTGTTSYSFTYSNISGMDIGASTPVGASGISVAPGAQLTLYTPPTLTFNNFATVTGDFQVVNVGNIMTGEIPLIGLSRVWLTLT